LGKGGEMKSTNSWTSETNRDGEDWKKRTWLGRRGERENENMVKVGKGRKLIDVGVEN
jgi:hypothetical protein